MAKRRQKQAGPMYDPATVKAYAHGRWSAILADVGGLSIDILDGNHYPCPKCGGTDRFRFTDIDGHGSVLCNQCARHKIGDGLAALGWFNGWNFTECLTRVAEHLGIPAATAPATAGGQGRKQGQRESADPAKDLEPLEWSDGLAGLWCLTKPPIVPGSIVAVGGRLARYRQQYTVIDLPILSLENGFKNKEANHSQSSGSGDRAGRGCEQDRLVAGNAYDCVGHALYNVSGGTLPKYTKSPNGQPPKVEHKKTKLTYGSQPGLIGTIDRLSSPGCDTIIKVEGCTDVLTAVSIADLPATVAVVTNANGAGEHPAAWMVELFRGKRAIVIGDADRPGVDGARQWAAALATVAAESRLVKLPYEIVNTHGKDLRDWISEEVLP